MRVEPLLPDAAPLAASGGGNAGSFAMALDALGAVLGSAERAEDAFADGGGTLQEAVYERARADVALSVATATAQRVAQSVQSISICKFRIMPALTRRWLGGTRCPQRRIVAGSLHPLPWSRR